MHSTYAQTQKTAQKKEASTAAAVLDASSQSEGLQRKADIMNNAAQREEVPRPNNTGMPDNLKSGIESLSGFSMDDVRVHYNSSKPATVQALAYTQGTDIHVAPGQEKHLPHEAWHVAQQMAGRVSPTTNINGMPVNDNAGLEHEADVMGEKAVQCKKKRGNAISKTLQFVNNIIQRVLNNTTEVFCAADIDYHFRGEAPYSRHEKSAGSNVGGHRANEVQRYFRNIGLIRLGSIPKVTNSPGACAEPQAVYNTLNKIEKNFGIQNIEIDDIFISDAVIKRKPGYDITSWNVALMRNNKVPTYERCRTCQQWIWPSGHVHYYYLQKDLRNTAPPRAIRREPWHVRNRILPKPTRGDFNNQIRPRGYFRHEDDYFHDVDFSTIPEMLFDTEFQMISAKKGLRTVIKKEMLKVRARQLGYNLDAEIEEIALQEKRQGGQN